MEILPNLDLFNFTDPVAGESQYILTSPRSLEACSRFGIKPVELLPKTAEEFEEEYGGILTENPSVIYKKSEKERLRKLRLCRQERERIIEEKNLLGTGSVACTASGDENGESENMPSLSSTVFRVTDSPNRNKNLWRDSLRENVSPRRSPKKIKEKPSILDYLDAATTSSYSPRMSIPLSLDDEEAYKHCTTYDALSDSAICPANDITKKKQSKVKRSQSSRTKRDLSLLSLDDDLDTLPKNMKGSQSHISAKDKEMLGMYLLKEQSNGLPRECVQCWTTETKPAGNTKNKMAFDRAMEDTVAMNQSLGRKEKLKREDKDARLKEAKEREARLDREVDIINCRASKWQEKYRKQMQKMDEKLNSIQKDKTEGRVRKFGNEIPSNNVNSTEERIKYQPNHRARSPTRLSCQTSLFHDSQKKEKQTREEHLAQLSELEDKHKRAGETFQQRMKQKIRQRELNKMKTQERKEFQERQLSVMERDLELWQKELKNYQEICTARAEKLVQKKHAITSLKTHQKRHEREVDHAMMKSKVDEEAKLRQEELETLVNIKDERSRMIITAKEEFANAGRDSALMTRTIKDRVNDKKLKSTFDKMAYNGALMSRLERIPSQRKAPPTSVTSLSKQRKNQSVLMLG